MRDDDRVWLDVDDEATAGGRPRRLLAVLAIAAVPWAIVAALVLVPDRGGGQPHPATADASAEGAAAEQEITQVQPEHSANRADQVREPEPTEVPPASPSPPDDGPRSTLPQATDTEDPSDQALARALGANATIIARAWLTEVTPHLDITGVTPTSPGLYAEHLVVEAIEQPGPDAAVVTLLTILLAEDDLGDLTAALHRLAVPLIIDEADIRPAGSPWWLPAPPLLPVALHSEAESDPDLLVAAADALIAAGYDDVEVAAIARSERWPWIAEVRATAPGGAHFDAEVWLRLEHDGFQLAGAAASAAEGAAAVPGSQP